MGRTLQKKKNRSSVPRATLKPKSKKRPVKASPLVAAQWDKNLTLSQNYRNLGLASKLNTRTGGTEVNAKDIEESQGTKRGQDSLAVGASQNAPATGLETTKVLRDEDGRILRVVHEQTNSNPLNDPLTALDPDSDTEKQHPNERCSNHDRSGGVIAALEAAAEAELAEVRRRKKPRKQSQKEQEWIQALVERYGHDVQAMSRDKKLNPNQQTEADIGRRIRIWKQSKRSTEDE